MNTACTIVNGKIFLCESCVQRFIATNTETTLCLVRKWEDKADKLKESLVQNVGTQNSSDVIDVYLECAKDLRGLLDDFNTSS